MKTAIIGAGNMGGAIARGLARGTIVKANEIFVANPSNGKLDALKAEFPEINVTNDNDEVVKRSRYHHSGSETVDGGTSAEFY